MRAIVTNNYSIVILFSDAGVGVQYRRTEMAWKQKKKNNKQQMKRHIVMSFDIPRAERRKIAGTRRFCGTKRMIQRFHDTFRARCTF